MSYVCLVALGKIHHESYANLPAFGTERHLSSAILRRITQYGSLYSITIGMHPPRVETSVRKAKGEVIGSGVSGIVELVSSDRVTKSPWPGSDAKLCHRDIQLEAEVYRMLENSQLYPKFFGYDFQDGSITLEYMRNGDLREYIRKHHNELSVAQRYEWTLAVTRGLRTMHSYGVLHCDFSPRNILLDDRLQAKVADFGGCSIYGSWSSAMGSTRFQQPRQPMVPPTTDNDIFSLGSTIYEIMTGKIPYEEVSSAQVKQLYSALQFPDLVGVHGAELIRNCWLLRIKTLDEALRMIQAAATDFLMP